MDLTKSAALTAWLMVLAVVLAGCRREAPAPVAAPDTAAAPATPAAPEASESAAATADQTRPAPATAPAVEAPENPKAPSAESVASAPTEQAPLPAAKPEEIPQVEHTLELTGSALKKPTTFTYAQLAQMRLSPLYDVLMQKSHSPDEMTSWQGVRLAELLRLAEVTEGPLRLELKAKDGFEMRSTSEVMATALLALKNGKGEWLAKLEDKCPVRIVVPQKPGNYWIMNPIRISVEPAE